MNLLGNRKYRKLKKRFFYIVAVAVLGALNPGCAQYDNFIFPIVRLKTDDRSIDFIDGSSIVVTVARNNKFSPLHIWIAPYGVRGRHKSIRIDVCRLVSSEGKVFTPENLQRLELAYKNVPAGTPNEVSAQDVFSDDIHHRLVPSETLTLEIEFTNTYQNSGSEAFSLSKTFRQSDR